MVTPYHKFPACFVRINHIFHKGLSYPWPYRIVRIALAGLFIYGGVTNSSIPKHLPQPFPPMIWRRRRFSRFCRGLPLIETIVGLALVLDRPWGLHLITGLLALFVFVLGYGILGDLNVDCGCFGAEELDKRAGLWAAFYRDLILIGVVAPYLYLSRRVRGFNRFLLVLAARMQAGKLLAGIIIAFFVAAGVYLNQRQLFSAGLLLDLLGRHPVLAPLIFLGVYAVAPALFLPSIPLTLAAGFFWGPVWGVSLRPFFRKIGK